MSVAVLQGVSLGDTITRGGCVTRLVDLIGRSPEELEDIIGYHRGRLAMGYYLSVLTEPIGAGEFIYAGYTTWSGGKFGLPDAQKRQAVEDARVKIHDNLKAQVGDAGIATLQKQTVANIPLMGVERLAKCMPVIDHNKDMDKDPTLPVQYPKGAGIKQYILTTGKKFRVAAQVKPTGEFLGLSGFQARLASNTPYEQRVAIRKYLEKVM